jgi:hypothetical protein
MLAIDQILLQWLVFSRTPYFMLDECFESIRPTVCNLGGAVLSLRYNTRRAPITSRYIMQPSATEIRGCLVDQDSGDTSRL